MFSLDSPLLNIPRDLSRRLVDTLDGVRVCFEVAELAYLRLLGSLDAISDSELDQQARRTHIVSASADAWTIVDAVHRLRLLVPTIPGLKQKEPTVQIFMRSTEAVTELRHWVQHLNERIPKDRSSTTPLWGAIAWRTADGPAPNVQNGHVIAAGTFGPGVGIDGPNMGHSLPNLDAFAQVSMTADGYKVDLGKLVASLQPLARYIENAFRAKFAGRAAGMPDTFITAPTRVVLEDNADVGDGAN